MKSLVKFFNGICYVYTATALVLLLLRLAVAGSFENTLIRPQAFLLILPFAVGMSALGLLYRFERVPFGLRLVMHYAASVACAFLFLYLPTGALSSASGGFLAVILMSLLYWMIMGAYLALDKARARRVRSQTEYQSVFRK